MANFKNNTVPPFSFQFQSKAQPATNYLDPNNSMNTNPYNVSAVDLYNARRMEPAEFNKRLHKAVESTKKQPKTWGLDYRRKVNQKQFETNRNNPNWNKKLQEEMEDLERENFILESRKSDTSMGRWSLGSASEAARKLKETDIPILDMVGGVAESYFNSMLGVFRKTQLTASSFAEGVLTANEATHRGNITDEQLYKEAADEHLRRLQLEDRKRQLQEQLDLVNEAYFPYSESPEQWKKNPQFNEAKDRWNALTNEIKQIDDYLGDKDSMQLDNIYKREYVKDKEGIVDTAVRWSKGVTNAIERWINPYEYREDAVVRQEKEQNAIDSLKYDQLMQQEYKNYVADTDGNNIPIKDYKSFEFEKQQADLFKGKRDQKIKDEQEDIKDDQQAAYTLQKMIPKSRAWEAGREVYQNASVFNSAYWKYVVPEMLGTSNSSPSQAIGTAAKVIGTAAAMYTTGGASTAIMAGTAAGTTPLDIAGAVDENQAEKADKRVTSFIDLLKSYEIGGKTGYEDVMKDLRKKDIARMKAEGFSDEYIKEKLTDENVVNDYLAGLISTNDPRAYNSALLSHKGLPAMFEANMARTAGELAIQKPLEFGLPVEKLFTKAIGIGARTVLWPVGKAAEKILGQESKYVNGILSKSKFVEKSAEFGARAGDMVGGGVVGSMAGRGIGAATGVTLEAIGKMMPNAAKTAAKKIGKTIGSRYQNVYDKIVGEKIWPKYAAKYGLTNMRQIGASSISEMYEESVQYINSKKDFTKYGYDGAPIEEIIASDMQSGGEAFKAYMAYLGIGESKYLDDTEFWANAKGGFALGGLHTAFTTTGGNVSQAFDDYMSEKTMDIGAQSVAERESGKINRTRNTVFAKEAMDGRSSNMISVLEDLKKQDGRRESPNFSQSAYDDMIDDAKQIVQLTNDKHVKGILEAKGIKYGTDDYAIAVADIQQLYKQRQANNEARQQQQQILNSAYDGKELDEIIDKVSEESLATNVGAQIEVSKIRVKAANKAVDAEIEATKKANEEAQRKGEETTDINSEEFKAHLNDVREKAMADAEVNANQNLRQNMKSAFKLATKLKALLKLNDRFESIDELYKTAYEKFGLKTLRPDAKLIKRNVEQQIKQVKGDLKQLGVDISGSDQDIIQRLGADKRINLQNQDQIDAVEVAMALIDADNAVTQHYLDQFNYGVVQSNKNKYQYNKAEFDRKKKAQDDLQQAIFSGDKQKIEEAIKRSSEVTPYEPTPGQEKEDDYLKRLNAIKEANERNAKLNWIVSDIYSGDAVTKLEEARDDMIQEEQKAQQSEQASQTQGFDSSTKGPSVEQIKQQKAEEDRAQRITNLKKKLGANKDSYHKKLQKAKAAYRKRKENLKKFRRSTLSASVIPGLNQIIDVGNALLTVVEDGYYSFERFVKDVAAIVDDVKLSDMLPVLKQQYIIYRTKLQFKNSDLVENMSTIEEVRSYGINPVQFKTQVNPKVAAITNALQDDYNKVDQEVSSHYDIIVEEDGNYKIYTNDAAIAYHLKDKSINATIQAIVNDLEQTKSSDEAFVETINKYARKFNQPEIGEAYLKYKNVPGIEDAIARKVFVEQNPSIQLGELVRNTVLQILTGNEDKIDKSVLPSKGIDEFIQNVKIFKDRYENAGYTLVETPRYAYTNGKASELDIILQDADGALFSVDVRIRWSGDTNLSWFMPAGRMAPMTIEQHSTLAAHQVEDILVSKFNRPMSGLALLPILADYSDDVIGVEGGNNADIIFIQRQYEGVDENKQKLQTADMLYENAVLAAKEYEDIVKQAKRLNIEITYNPEEIPQLDKNTSNENIIDQYIKTIQDKIEEIELQKKILDDKINSTSEDFYTIQVDTGVLPDDNVEDLINNVYEACRELDMAANQVSNLKATTQQDKINLDKLYQCLIDAQLALDLAIQNETGVDFSNEETLIASQIERLVQNVENYGPAAYLINNWWADEMSKLSDSQTGSKYIGYFNKIDSWIQTLEQHLFKDLDGDEKLQAWYSALLNNYFSKLLDSAEQMFNRKPTTPEEADLSKRGLELVNKGRKFIEEFNLGWGTMPDENYPGPPANEVEEINRMPIKWKDLYTVSDSHSPAFTQMRSNLPYIEMSKIPDFLDNIDTEFEINKNGEVVLFIGYPKGAKKTLFCTLGFINEPYDGASEQVLKRMADINRGNKKFIAKVRRALQYVKDHKGWKISYDLFTNKGSIIYDAPGKLHPVTEFLFGDEANAKDLKNIRLSDKSRIGILTVANTAKGPIYTVYAGTQLKQPIGRFDQDYIKQHLRINSGSIIYFYNNGEQEIGVPIPAYPIGTSGAQALVDLIKRYSRGERQIEGYDILDLIKLRLYTFDESKHYTPYNNIQNQLNILQNGVVSIGADQYVIGRDDAALTDRIAEMPNVTRAEQLNEKIYQSSNSALARAASLLQSGSDELTLPNGIVLTKEDLQYTWLGYMMNRGLLGTRATGTRYKQINIKNLRIVSKTEDSITETPNNINPGEAEKDIYEQMLESDIEGLFMTVKEKDVTPRDTIEEQAFRNKVLQFFTKLFGNEAGEVYFDDAECGYLSRISQDAVSVGVATSEFVKFAKSADDKVIYHEAFHKLLELVLPAEDREKIYSIYRASMADGVLLSDRQVAEGLADMFTDFVEMQEDYKFAKGFGKVKKYFKFLIKTAGVIFKLGISNGSKLFSFFNSATKGKYQNKPISTENKKRFQELFGDKLYYTVKNNETGVSKDFEYIANASQLNDMVKSLSFYILGSLRIHDLSKHFKRGRFTLRQNVLSSIRKEYVDDLCGKDVKEEELTFQQKAFREVFQYNVEEYKDAEGNTKKRRHYYNFEALIDRVGAYMDTILNEHRGKLKPNDEDEDNDNLAQTGNIDKFDRLECEFSKLNSLSQKVKLFFATIPYFTIKDGKLAYDMSKNIYGTPSYMPLEETFGIVVNELHDVTSIHDLDRRLEVLSESGQPMYKYIYKKFHNIVYGAGNNPGIYTFDDQGHITSVDYDREQVAIGIVNAIRSQKIDFMIAMVNNIKSGGKQVNIIKSSLNRDAKVYARNWSQLLISGQIPIFKHLVSTNNEFVFNQSSFIDGKDIFTYVADYIDGVRYFLQQNTDSENIGGKTYDKLVEKDGTDLRKDFVSKLRSIGIQVSDDAIVHMLFQKYGNAGFDGLSKWLADKDTNVNAFIQLLKEFTLKNGTPNTVKLRIGYTQSAFVSRIAETQSSYDRITTENMALGLNGKQMFSISQNNTISHILSIFNLKDSNAPLIKTLLKFGYNLFNDGGIQKGSILLKTLLDPDKKVDFKAKTYLGTKTDNYKDQGTEYQEEPTVDDYIAKMAMLQEGYMISPTLADKGTWVFIDGVEIPGMRFNGKGDAQTVDNVPTIQRLFGKPVIVPSEIVLRQFREYCESERRAIMQCMVDLGYSKIPGYDGEYRKNPIEDKYKIKNYHTKNKQGVEPNGTRFWSLTEIAVPEGGKIVVYNLNDPNKSSKDLLKLANEKFFNKSVDEQNMIIALTLQRQTQQAVQKAIDLGILTREQYKESWQDANGQMVEHVTSNEDGSLVNLQTTKLDERKILALQQKFMEQLGFSKTQAGRKRTYMERQCRSLAIAAIFNDVTNRSIISSEEFLRCFAGHPGLYKVLYDKQKGVIKDSTFDIQKRIGGLISTGEDNIEGLPEVSATYTCAEINDYEIGSPATIMSSLKASFIEGEAREIFAETTGNWTEAYSAPLEDILQGDVEKIATENGTKYFDSYTDGINVADGAAYITDKMCEDLLRRRGAYNSEVKKAFELLRDPKASWKQSKDAYKTIYDAVNIVTTKYTAYGFRDHVVNNNDVSNVSVAYYNKYALFPLFPGIATGKLAGIYKKMNDEKVDMLLMTSAVKVGSVGAVSYDGTKISEPFNTYEQNFEFVRRQLNTDPEESPYITFGTQAIKIGLQNLRTERRGKAGYVDFNTGELIDGNTLLDTYMDCINKLSEIGEDELKEQFFEEDGETIDPEKLSAYLTRELTSRNANKAIIEAIQVEEIDGKKRLVCPLAATPDATWIESILISTVNKKIIDIVTPGSSFTQRSVFAMDAQNGEGKILADTDTNLYGGKRLQMINSEGSMDAVISIDYFKGILPKGLSFNEAKQWLIDRNIIGENAKAGTIGYRIPTQAQSSIHALRFVDVVEGVQGTIILPEEFTKITGSDFDIDHLYLASYNYKEDGSHDYESGSKEYYQNKIIDVLLTLLTDEKSRNQLFKSIDNDTSLVKDIADQIPETSSSKHMAYNFGTLHEQVERKNDYITGKKGIGPFALNVTNHILAHLYGVKFKDTAFTQQTSIQEIGKLMDDEHNYVSSWLSAFINAHVDIVKDPYISKLNVNPYTYNMLNLLIRCGKGSAAVWFLSQPIIKELAYADNNAQSQFMLGPGEASSIYDARQKAKQKVLLKYFSEEELDSNLLATYTGNKKQDIDNQIYAVNRIFQFGIQDLIDVAIDPTQMPYPDFQKDVYKAWLSLEKYSVALSNLVQHTKIDTRKQGKTIIETLKYLDGYTKIFFPKGGSIWDMDSLTNLRTRSWIGSKTIRAIALPMGIIGEYTFNGNRDFANFVLNSANLLKSAEADVLNSETLVFLSKQAQTAIKSKYIIQYARDVLKKSDKDIADLFIGKDSMANRLIRFKYVIERGSLGRLKDNVLLNALFSEMQRDPIIIDGKEQQLPNFISIKSFVMDDPVQANMAIDGWNDLLQDENESVRNFARDLIVYAFLTSGENRGWNNLFKFVPIEWIVGQHDDYQSYSDFVRTCLSDTSSMMFDQLLDDIVSNNFMDRKLAKRVPFVDPDTGEANFIAQSDNVLLGKPSSIDNIEKLPKYITLLKQSYTSSKRPAAYDVYKLVGEVQYGSNYIPIYMKMQKRGYHEYGRDIFEYGWDMNYAENTTTTMGIKDQQYVDKVIRKYLQEFVDDENADLNAFMYELEAAQTMESYYDEFTDIYYDVPGMDAEEKFDINTISDKSADYGVEIIPGGSTALKDNYVTWQQQHPEGIVAYRVNFNEYNTSEEANAGRIGNPFSENARGKDTVQQFYEWLTTGNNFGNAKATEEYRQAIIQRILNTPENAPVLYYTELNRPSHATVLGYLVNNKQLLQQQALPSPETKINTGNSLLDQAINSNEHENC